MNRIRRDDHNSGKGPALLSDEDEDKIVHGITCNAFNKILPTFSTRAIYQQLPKETYITLVELVDLATLFNMIQMAYFFTSIESRRDLKGRSNGKCLMDLACQTLVNKVHNKTFGEIREGFKTDHRHRSFDHDECHRLSVLLSLQQHFIYTSCLDGSANNILRNRGKEIFIKNAMLEDLWLSPFVSTRLSFVNRREKQCSDYLHELKECFSRDFERLSKIINSLSLLVSSDRNLGDLLDSYTAKCLLEIVRYYEKRDIQCQAVYILSRVNSNKYYDLMTNDVIPVLLKLMSDSYYNLAVAAVIALTRIAITFPGCIEDIVDKDGLEAALEAAKKCRDNQKIICCLARFSAVVCRSYDLPPDKVEVAVTISEEIFLSEFDFDYHKVHACHTLQYLTYGRDVEIGEQMLHKLVGFMYKFMRIEDTLIASSALGVVGNIARWGNLDTIQVLTSNCMLLSCLKDIMCWCTLKFFWLEACQIISNIAARSGTFTIDMDGKIGLIECLCSVLEKKDDYEVKMEAAWALCNCIYGKRRRKILHLRADIMQRHVMV